MSERRSGQRQNSFWKLYQEMLSDGVRYLSAHRVGCANEDIPQPCWKTSFKGEYRTLMRCVHFPISQNGKRNGPVLRYSNSRSNSTAHWIHMIKVRLPRWGTREAVPVCALRDLSEVTHTRECHRSRRESQIARRAHKYGIA